MGKKLRKATLKTTVCDYCGDTVTHRKKQLPMDWSVLKTEWNGKYEKHNLCVTHSNAVLAMLTPPQDSSEIRVIDEIKMVGLSLDSQGDAFGANFVIVEEHPDSAAPMGEKNDDTSRELHIEQYDPDTDLVHIKEWPVPVKLSMFSTAVNSWAMLGYMLVPQCFGDNHPVDSGTTGNMTGVMPWGLHCRHWQEGDGDCCRCDASVDGNPRIDHDDILVDTPDDQELPASTEDGMAAVFVTLQQHQP